MAGFDSNVSVIVTTGIPSIGEAGFGVPMLATADLGAGFTERIRFYTTAAAITADGDVNADAQATAILALAQAPHVARVAIGRVAFVSLAVDLQLIEDEDPNWYGFTIDSVVDADVLAAAAWAQDAGKLFIAVTNDVDVIGALDGIAFDLAALGYTRTAVIYRDVGAVVQVGTAMAWMGKTLATDPDVRTTIWYYKTLAGVVADEFTDTEVSNALSEPANLYTTFKGSSVMGEGRTVNNLQIDVLISQDWTTQRIEERSAALLVDSSNSGGKIPLTDAGIALIAAVPRNVFDQGVPAEHFIANSYKQTVTRRSQMSDADVQNRLVRVDFSAELAGAAEKLAYTGTLLISA